MADSPPYTDTRDDADVGPDRRATTGISRWQKVVGIIGLVVILWVGNGMFDNFFPSSPGPGGPDPSAPGPGGHGPGGDTPVENQERDTDTEDDGDMHDPSQQDHG